MHTRNTLLTVVGLLLYIASGATAGDVTGQVALGGKSGGRDVVVYLQGSVKSRPLAQATVDQRDKMFLPHVSVVTQGTTVHFPNDDTVFHNVFAYFQAKKFDLGMYPRGATKSVTFDKTGLVVLLCNIHSDMSAYILVVDTPYYAVTDQQGRYRIANVPPGTYTLHAWHESGADLTQTVTINASNTPLSFTLNRK
jgi:plastocyanin